MAGVPSATFADRLTSKYIVLSNGCWEWVGSISQFGYGEISVGAKGAGKRPAHRAMYELLVGLVEGGKPLDHLCHRPNECAGGITCPHRRCVNPEHLSPSTPRENSLRSNSPAALNARKTHCDRGHELTPENVYTYRGRRDCKKCNTIRCDAWRRRQREREK